MQFKPYTDYVRDLEKRLKHIRTSHKAYRYFGIQMALYVSDNRTLHLGQHMKLNGKVKTIAYKQPNGGAQTPMNDVVFWRLIDDFLSKQEFLAYQGGHDMWSFEDAEQIITDDYRYDLLRIETTIDEKGTYDKCEHMVFVGFDTRSDLVNYCMSMKRPDLMASEPLRGILQYHEIQRL